MLLGFAVALFSDCHLGKLWPPLACALELGGKVTDPVTAVWLLEPLRDLPSFFISY